MLPHPPFRPSLRHPLWCPPNQPHPVPRRATPLLPLPLLLPPPPLLLLSPACPPTGPRNRSLPYHRATPRTDSPITRPPPILTLPSPTPCLPADSSSLCATPLSVSSLFRLPSPLRPSPLPLPPSPLSLSLFLSILPLPRDARRHPLWATSTPESRARWNTTGSSAIIFCPIVCRACMRARECERDERNGERMRERTAI